MGRALLRLVRTPSAEQPLSSETPTVVEKAKRVGRWAVFLVTGVRAEVWQATAHEPAIQREREIKPLVNAESNLTAALRELDTAAAQKPAIQEAADSTPLAKVYEFPAPRHPERQTPVREPAAAGGAEDTPVALQQESPPYEVNNSFPISGNELKSVASASALTVSEAMRRITNQVERPPLRAGIALPAAVAVAAGLGISRRHWRREAQMLRRENIRHEEKLQARETTLRHLQAERPNLREIATRQAYVGEVASFANREAAEIREIAHEVRAESRTPIPPAGERSLVTSEQPAGTAPQPERPHRIDARESHTRLTTRTPEVTAAVRELSSAEKAEAASSQEVTEQQLASRIEQLDRDNATADAQLAARLAAQATAQTTGAREAQAAQKAAQQLRQQRQLQTVSYVILIITTMAMIFAALVWL